jgi:hypothetical protein
MLVSVLRWPLRRGFLASLTWFPGQFLVAPLPRGIGGIEEPLQRVARDAELCAVIG